MRRSTVSLLQIQIKNQAEVFRQVKGNKKYKSFRSMRNDVSLFLEQQSAKIENYQNNSFLQV
jgi:hypothetical protein